MKMQKNIEISFWGVFVNFIGYLFFIILYFWLVLTTEYDSSSDLITLILVSPLIVVFSFYMCVNFYKLVKQIPTVIINEEGITSNFSGFNPYTIRWQEIDSIRIKSRLLGYKYVVISSIEKEKYIKDLPWDNRIYLLLSKRSLREFFVIPMNNISYKTAGTADEFYSYLQDYWKASTKSEV